MATNRGQVGKGRLYINDLKAFRMGCWNKPFHEIQGLSGDTQVLHAWMGLKKDPNWKEVHGFAIQKFIPMHGEVIGAWCSRDLSLAMRKADEYAADGWKVSRKTWEQFIDNFDGFE